jgi:hypothetical protein
MDFLIQTIEGEVKHDFSFVLREAIKSQNWFANRQVHSYTLSDEPIAGYIPVGANDFVISYLEKHHGMTPQPINIPAELNTFEFTKRNIIYGTHEDIQGKKFVKSTDKIKGFTDITYFGQTNHVPHGTYIISDLINIESEWRAFVYKGKLVGLNNYSGEFTMFPDVPTIQKMISVFKTQPIAFTLDVGVNDTGTFVIEVHDFFSCGLYGFADSRILPNMFGDWFNEYVKNNGSA